MDYVGLYKHAKASGTYWNDEEDGTHLLYVGDQRRAIVACRWSATILPGHDKPYAQPEAITVPKGAVVCDEIERRLGLPRIDAWLYRHGFILINWRFAWDRAAESNPQPAPATFALLRSRARAWTEAIRVLKARRTNASEHIRKMPTSDEYRRKAADCAKLADQTGDETERGMLRRMAEQWERLAEHKARRESQASGNS